MTDEARLAVFGIPGPHSRPRIDLSVMGFGQGTLVLVVWFCWAVIMGLISGEMCLDCIINVIYSRCLPLTIGAAISLITFLTGYLVGNRVGRTVERGRK